MTHTQKIKKIDLKMTRWHESEKYFAKTM